MPRAMPPMMTAVSTGLRRRLLRAMRTLYRSIVASLRRLQRAAEKRRRAVDVDHPSVEEVDLARCPRRAFRAVRDHDDGHAAVAQRNVDVVEEVEIGDQVEALKDEADFLIADVRHLAVGEPADVFVVELVDAAVEDVEESGHVEKGGLARSRGAHDGHELPGLDVEGEILQGMRFHELGPVNLPYVLHAKHRSVSFSPQNE